MKNLIIRESNSLKLKGIHTFTLATIETPIQKALAKKIDQLREAGEEYMHFVRELNAMCKTRVYTVDNLITTAGLAMIANNLTAAVPQNEMKINYSSVGTGATAVAAGDIALVTETYRRAIASTSNSSNIARASAYYNATETSGLFKEHGIWADATSVASSGILFSRVLLNGGAGINKTTSESLTIDYTVTLTAA